MEIPSVLFIVGPTAVGKTAFAIKLARMTRGEIVSADSMQAYRYMDIMSQKPTPRQRKAVKHHGIGIIDPRREYSAALFAEKTERFISGILRKGNTPIITGGSGLYVKGLIDGLFPAPKKDTALRESLKREAGVYGSGRLYERLKEIDPKAANGIHPNDTRRIIRALEIFHLTGIPITTHKKNTKGIKDKYTFVIYGLTMARSLLYKRIDDRADSMFAKGLVKEAAILRRKRPGMTASAVLGYKEVCGYLDKKYSLREASDLLKKKTRHLAKKQMTWFRQDKRIKWIDVSGGDAAGLEYILKETGWKRR